MRRGGGGGGGGGYLGGGSRSGSGELKAGKQGSRSPRRKGGRRYSDEGEVEDFSFEEEEEEEEEELEYGPAPRQRDGGGWGGGARDLEQALGHARAGGGADDATEKQKVEEIKTNSPHANPACQLCKCRVPPPLAESA